MSTVQAQGRRWWCSCGAHGTEAGSWLAIAAANRHFDDAHSKPVVIRDYKPTPTRSRP